MSRFSAPISEQIWDMKYRFKDNEGEPIDVSVEDTWNRIANALSEVEDEYDPEVGSEYRYRQFYNALEDFKFLPAGRIIAGAGTARAVTLFNCFVMGTIPDSMDGIFSMLREAALTMQQGGGIGYDFTPIRPSTSRVKKLGADASGPLSFMDCWDAMCRTVMSAGSRRGAMMATMSCTHPDIEKFIEAKRDSAKLRMFNLSVLVTDRFMRAVEENEDWPLTHAEPPMGESERVEGGWLHKTVKARDLWNLIMQATYDVAEPGVIFIDRVNELNNLKLFETIAATNPCGEQPLPPYGACLLGSINLAKFVRDAFVKGATWNLTALKQTVRTAVRMMDNVIDVSKFPLEAQREEAQNKRRIGLGVTGLADALAMLRLTYGSDEAVAATEFILRQIALESYLASAELAKEKGPFPLWDEEVFPAPGSHLEMLCEEFPELEEAVEHYGLRNALLTSIAPTGTISLYAGNVSSGIEPIFALSYKRKVLQPDGSKTEELVEDYAVAEYRKFWVKNRTRPGEFNPDEDLPEQFVTAQTLSPEAHLKMQAAAQRWVDSSISKTINLPEDIEFNEFKNVYWEAYETGCKGCTTYRPNDVTGSVLSVDEKPKEEAPVIDVEPNAHEWEPEAAEAHYGHAGKETSHIEEVFVDGSRRYWPVGQDGPVAHDPEAMKAMLAPNETLPKRPEELKGSTYKIKIGDQSAVYLTVNDVIEPSGVVRPFEVFLRSGDPSHDEWMVAMARTISAVLRRPYDARFLARELRQVHSPITGGFGMGKHMPSLVAAIGTKLEEHMDRVHLSLDAAQTVTGLYKPEEAVTSEQPVKMLYATCKECLSTNLKNESGCVTCLDCGSSKCG